MCQLTRCIGPGTALVALFCRRSNLFQSKASAKPESEFIHQARFVPGWNFGEGQHLARNTALASDLVRIARIIAYKSFTVNLLRGAENLQNSSSGGHPSSSDKCNDWFGGML